MRFVAARFIPWVIAGACLAHPGGAGAQPTAADPMAPRQPLPAPAGLRPFPTPPEIATRELTLAEALTIALGNQPQIQARLGDYVAALQRIDQALSPMLPQIAAAASGTRSDQAVRVFSHSGSSFTGTVSTGAAGRFSASQLLWDFGKTWAATEAEKARAEFSREDVELTKDLIVLAVKESNFNLLFAARLVVVSAQALDRAELNLRSAQGFFDVGTRPKSDVTRAEVDVANARVDLIRAQNAVSLARIALNTSMGISINSPTRVRDILTYEKFPIDQQTLVAEALQRRPEYRQAKYRVDASEATVRQTFRDFFPQLSAVGSVGGSTTRSESGGAATGESGDWALGLQLSWSIFDGGNRIARWKEAKANLDASKARVRDAELTIWQQVEQAYVNVTEAEERIGAAQKAVESAQENFRLFQGRFDAGVGNIIELTDAQLALTRAQSSEAQARADFRIASARLERAVGRR
ncbi:MAG TPA: TolC family protein [Candidatus Limnocylindrales bacterium]|nr:TolC family protein [Candidatus Limnocylindrales bacterium]